MTTLGLGMMGDDEGGEIWEAERHSLPLPSHLCHPNLNPSLSSPIQAYVLTFDDKAKGEIRQRGNAIETTDRDSGRGGYN